MSNMPNVSSVYRDLAHIYSNSGFVGKGSQPVTYSLQPKISNQKTCFEQMYAYKQKRHNQLMSRLKNSTQQHRRIVGGFQQSSSYTNINPSYSYNERKQYSFQQPVQNQPYHSMRNQLNKVSNFVMPKIKYRHIEDQKQRYTSTQPQLQTKNSQRQQRSTVSPNKQTPQYQQLQKQFYQDGTQKNSFGHQKNNSGTGTQTRNPNQNSFKNIQQQDGKSQVSYRTNTFNRSSKNAQYEDKLESYYELCRKNLSNKNQDLGKPKQQKFVRGNTNKNRVMKLDQAIKLLSID